MPWYYKVLIGIAVVGAAILAAVTLGGVKLPVAEIEEALNARAEAKRAEAAYGKKEAVRQIKERYKQTLQDMDRKEQQEVERLSDNPAALSSALLRAGRKAAKRRV